MNHRLKGSTAALHFVPSRRGDSVDRPHLSSTIFKARHSTKLAVVHGPAGTGKTTVLTQWAHYSSPPTAMVIWVTLSSDDRGRTVFWQRVITAIQDAGVATPDSFLARLDTASLGQITLGASLFRAIASLTNPVVLVVDDYHVVDDPSVASDIIALLSNSSNISVAIGTRTQSLLTSVETAARIPTVVHDSRDFAFTLAETETLLEQHAFQRPELAPMIHAATAGWPLATRALLVEAQAVKPHEKSHMLSDVHSHGSFVHEYVESTLSRRTEAGRLFLLRIAQCADVTVDLAALLSDIAPAEASAQLEALEHDGIATRRVLGPNTQFVLHPLVHASLRALSDANLPAADRRKVQRLYAEWLVRERPEKSFTLFSELKDLDSAARVLRHNFSILTSVHGAAVLAALQRLAVEELLREPILLSARLMLELSNPSTPLSWIRGWFTLITRALASRNPEDPSLSVADLVLLAGSERLMGEGKSALARSRVLVRKLADTGSTELAESRSATPLIHAVIGMTSLVNGDFETADAHYHLSGSIAHTHSGLISTRCEGSTDEYWPPRLRETTSRHINASPTARPTRHTATSATISEALIFTLAACGWRLKSSISNLLNPIEPRSAPPRVPSKRGRISQLPQHVSSW